MMTTVRYDVTQNKTITENQLANQKWVKYQKLGYYTYI